MRPCVTSLWRHYDVIHDVMSLLLHWSQRGGQELSVYQNYMKIGSLIATLEAKQFEKYCIFRIVPNIYILDVSVSAKLKLMENVHLWYKSVRKYTSGCRTYIILGSNWSLFHNKSIYSIAVADFGVYNASIIFRKWKML